MKNIIPAFDILEKVKSVQRCHQFVECHLLFDAKMENFCRKAKLVADSHMTKAPSAVTCASAVLYKTARTALIIVALNDLEVTFGHVENAYITVPCR
jgi:hypothetical protein